MAIQPGGYTDRPEDDNTNNAHPAFKRGKIQGILETLDILRAVIVGDDNGTGSINSPEIEKIRRATFLMREGLQQAADKTGVPASDKSTSISKPAKDALNESTKVAQSLRFQRKHSASPDMHDVKH